MIVNLNYNCIKKTVHTTITELYLLASLKSNLTAHFKRVYHPINNDCQLKLVLNYKRLCHKTNTEINLFANLKSSNLPLL